MLKGVDTTRIVQAVGLDTTSIVQALVGLDTTMNVQARGCRHDQDRPTLLAQTQTGFPKLVGLYTTSIVCLDLLNEDRSNSDFKVNLSKVEIVRVFFYEVKNNYRQHQSRPNWRNNL